MPIPVRATAAVLPPSNAPSAAYRGHHDVQAPEVDGQHFRTGWRVASRLQALADAGVIDRAQLEAAEQWGRWMERTAMPVTSRWVMKVDGGSPASGRIVEAYTLDAAKRLRACAAALGPEMIALLRACIVEDESFLSLSRRLGVACGTARRRTVAAIVALERHLAR